MNILYMIDFNCPYSYIGLNRVKKAAENLGINVEWELKSFELEPLVAKESIGTIDRYSEKYDLSTEQARNEILEIERIAQEDGLEMNFKDMTLRSSKDAHRISKFAQSKYPQITLDLVEKILHANFVENQNIKDNKLLSKLAVSCGITIDDAEKILNNNYYNIEVELDKEEALSHGITATPCFILVKKEEKLIIPGVFSTEEFETAMKDFDEGNIRSKSYGMGTLR